MFQAATQATEAGKSGISMFLDAGVIGLILTNGGLLIKALVDRKAVKSALEVAKAAIRETRSGMRGPEPGEGETCKKHGEAISALIEFKDNTKLSIEQIQADVRQIRDAVVK